MGLTGKIVSTPVSSDDVVGAMNYNNHDWGHFCSTGNINKWSLWKPVPFASDVSPTCLQMMQMHFGIDVGSARMTTLENAIKSPSNTQPAVANVGPPRGCYSYARPTGGASQPYRITDFAEIKDEVSPEAYRFERKYDHDACAPDEWHDWNMSETLLRSLARGAITSDNKEGSDTSWSLKNLNFGVVYSNCSVKIGRSSGEAIGSPSQKAMPLTFLFGNNTIANEKWRIGLVVYLPNGVSSISTTPRWMAFAGLKTLSASNGGEALPHTVSNLELCKALLYNFEKGVTDFWIAPIILKNCTISTPNNTSTIVTLVDSDGAQVLAPPNMSRQHLIISKTPIAGEVKDYNDGTFKGKYATTLNPGTYKVARKRIVTVAGSSVPQSQEMHYYRVVIPSGTSIVITHNTAYGATGNLQVSASGGNVTYYEYTSEANADNNTSPGAAQTTTPYSAGTGLFSVYVGTSATNVSLELRVKKLS